MQMWSDNWLATSLALDHIKTLYDCTLTLEDLQQFHLTLPLKLPLAPWAALGHDPQAVQSLHPTLAHLHHCTLVHCLLA